MVISCLTVYVIAFSSVIILLGRSYATTTPALMEMTARPNYRRGNKIHFHAHVKTNSSIDFSEASTPEQKLSETYREHSEKPKVLQTSIVPSSPSKLSNDSLRKVNATHSYVALVDPVNNVTKKLEVTQNLPPTIPYSVFLDISRDESNNNEIERIIREGAKSESKDRIINFIEWDVLQDSEKETRIHYNGVTAKETIVKTGVDEETGKRQGLKLRQLTDGTHFIQLIYNFENEIQDCEYIRQKAAIQKFLKTFRNNIENVKGVYEKIAESTESGPEVDDYDDEDDYVDEDEGKIEKYSLEDDDREQFEGELISDREYRNVTFQIIRSDEKLPREFAEWMNYSKLKRKCRENHRILRRLAFNRKHGNEFSKKLAEQHIERRKRDLMDVLLVPGTKWCGKGRRATKYTSLGGFSRTDKCCRVHDTMCPHWIGSLQEKYGLYNWRLNTIMHCRCDKRFRACLKMAKTGTANFVGKLFFNVVQTKCFVLKPQEVCLKYSWWGTCEKSEYRKKAYLRDNLSY